MAKLSPEWREPVQTCSGGHYKLLLIDPDSFFVELASIYLVLSIGSIDFF